mmetsp:Transcript_12487/g.37059  ORF Transcript_12487/g.37059 Transcript_12487/m.37059 type:complete len:284 (-) Transcript_12487:5-856(-)
MPTCPPPRPRRWRRRLLGRSAQPRRRGRRRRCATWLRRRGWLRRAARPLRSRRTGFPATRAARPTDRRRHRPRLWPCPCPLPPALPWPWERGQRGPQPRRPPIPPTRPPERPRRPPRLWRPRQATMSPWLPWRRRLLGRGARPRRRGRRRRRLLTWPARPRRAAWRQVGRRARLFWSRLFWSLLARRRSGATGARAARRASRPARSPGAPSPGAPLPEPLSWTRRRCCVVRASSRSRAEPPRGRSEPWAIERPSSVDPELRASRARPNSSSPGRSFEPSVPGK